MRRTLIHALVASLASVASFALLCSPAIAQDAGAARLSLIHGGVTTQSGASGDWVAGAINAPLVTGDSVATAADGRGEVQLDFADTLRLGENSQATLANLTNSTIQLQIGPGMVDYVQAAGAEATPELDTPNLAIHPQGPGVYRIQVNSDAETIVTVRAGDAEITTPQGNATLHGGQMITVQGTDDPQYQIADAPAPDDWDQWNQSRDQTVTQARSWSNTNRYYTGVEDLDAYGHWVSVPGYGQVWSPNTGPDWTPYSLGRWTYEPYWGWTWVSSEAWGWAPYHYGRWFYYGASWVWWPGPVRESPLYRPVWAPAYVSFVGLHAGGVSVGVGFGSIGWIPIGPADPYRPWYGGRVGVNVTVVRPLVAVGIAGRAHYSNLDLMYTDPHIARAFVSVPADRFGHGAVVREHVTPAEIRQGTVMTGRLPVAPPQRSAVAPRPGFQRFGSPARPEARPGARPEGRPEAGPATRPAPSAAPRPAPRPNDPNWHAFSPEKKPAAKPSGKKAPPKKDVPHDGGGKE